MKLDKQALVERDERSVPFLDQLQYSLADSRIVPVHGIIDNVLSSLTNFRLQYLLSRSDDPITIQLNSLGGDVYQGLALYDSIRAASEKTEINVVALGTCMSMAVVVLQAGTKRYSLPNTSFLMHEISSFAAGKLSELKDEQSEMARLEGVMNQIVADRTGMPVKKLQRLFERKDLFIDAKTAKRYNLIDKIVTRVGK